MSKDKCRKTYGSEEQRLNNNIKTCNVVVDGKSNVMEGIIIFTRKFLLNPPTEKENEDQNPLRMMESVWLAKGKFYVKTSAVLHLKWLTGNSETLHS